MLRIGNQYSYPLSFRCLWIYEKVYVYICCYIEYVYGIEFDSFEVKWPALYGYIWIYPHFPTKIEAKLVSRMLHWYSLQKDRYTFMTRKIKKED